MNSSGIARQTRVGQQINVVESLGDDQVGPDQKTFYSQPSEIFISWIFAEYFMKLEKIQHVKEICKN